METEEPETKALLPEKMQASGEDRSTDPKQLKLVSVGRKHYGWAFEGTFELRFEGW